MRRRSFFRRLLSVGAVAPLTAQSPAAAEFPDSLHQGGWTLQWLGWRGAIDSDWVVGVWTAQAGDRHVYSTTGGCVHDYAPGAVFDISHRNGVPLVTIQTPDAVKAARRMEAWQRLVAYLEYLGRD